MRALVRVVVFAEPLGAPALERMNQFQEWEAALPETARLVVQAIVGLLIVGLVWIAAQWDRGAP